jgi:hypothetical protein
VATKKKLVTQSRFYTAARQMFKHFERNGKKIYERKKGYTRSTSL